MLDVRSLVPAVVTVDALVLSALPRRIDLLALGLLVVLLVLYRAWRQLLWLVVTAAVMLTAAWGLSRGTGALAGGLGIAVAYLWRYCLAGAYGWFLVSTVRPTEFMAAMTRLRMPRPLLVPIAVVLRFVPTLVTEARAIAEAMRMRGLVTGVGSVLLHPLRTGELLVIPLLAAAVRSGDELTASALSRGFGSAGSRTTIVELRFGALDGVLLVLVASLAAYALGVLG